MNHAVELLPMCAEPWRFRFRDSDPIVERATRRAQGVLRGARTICKTLPSHVAAFAFEEAVISQLMRLSPNGAIQFEDAQSHDLRIGAATVELKCRSGNLPGDLARQRDFDMKVNAYNEGWQNPDYYIFGYGWHEGDQLCLDVMGYAEAALVKQPSRKREAGSPMGKSVPGVWAKVSHQAAYYIPISHLHPASELLNMVEQLMAA